MKLVHFIDTAGLSVAVNPEYVSKVSEKTPLITLIKLEKDDFVEVLQKFVEVVARLKK